MHRRLVPAAISVAVLVGILCLSLEAPRVEASGTIYIRANGLVEGTDKIVTADNVTYTFTDNINDSVVIERSNIVVNGNGYTLHGSGSGTALYWHIINNVTVRNTNIRDFASGIQLDISYNSTVSGNTITNSQTGVHLQGGANNTVSGNTIANSHTAIRLYGSNNNVFLGNTLTNSSTYGVFCDGCSNNAVSTNTISRSGTSIYLTWGANNNELSENTITNSQYGVSLYLSGNNTVSGNTITNSTNCGVSLRSTYNVVSGNTIANSNYCVYLDSVGNEIYHNNFINYAHPGDAMTSARWDDGYPSGGNYWSEYEGTDSDYDGIGDSNYTTCRDYADEYPLMGMFSSFNATADYHVQTICNSSISDFQYNSTAIVFNVSGAEGTTGFCRIRIPTGLMNTTYRVLVNGTEVTSNLLPCSTGTHSYLYFNYTHSIHEVVIIPEFSSLLILSLSLMATLVAVTVYRREQ